MAKTKELKQQIINQYREDINKSIALYVINPSQINPNEATELRKRLTPKDCRYNVIKNTLFAQALKESQKKCDQFMDFKGENAIIFCGSEPIDGARVIMEFTKSIKKGSIKGGILNTTYITAKDVENLALLPTRDVLLTMLVRTIATPITQLENLLNGAQRSFLTVLANISEK